MEDEANDIAPAVSPHQGVQQSLPPPPRSRGRMWVVGLLILLMAAVIFYLLSLLNSKRFYLVPEGNQLAVKKGVFFLWGNAPYQPQDPKEAELYAPIELPEILRGGEAKEFSELAALNREFATHLVNSATGWLFSEDEAVYAKGKAYLDRAGNLQGLDTKQVQGIQTLFADVDYVEARRAYQGIEGTLDLALRKLKNTETFGSGRFKDVTDQLRRVQMLLGALREIKNTGHVACEAVPVATPEVAPQAAEPAPAPEPSAKEGAPKAGAPSGDQPEPKK
jgi:hypothetical protein